MNSEESERISGERECLSPLHIAASNKDPVELSRLLAISHNEIDCRDPCQYTPLQISIQNNDLRSVNILLSHGSDFSLQVPNSYSDLIPGTNALSLASFCGHTDVLRMLMGYGCPITSKALYAAAESGNTDCAVKILDRVLKDGGGFADIATSEGIGEGLMIAAVGWRPEVVKVLLGNSRLKKDAINQALVSALRDISEYDDFHVIDAVSRGAPEGQNKRTETVKLLIDAGADVNYLSQSIMYGIGEMSPIHQVARMGNQAFEIFNLLLDKGAEIEANDEDGRTPLFYAVQSDYVYFAHRLIEKGAAISATDNHGSTPLHVATGNNTAEALHIISFLINHGADIESRDFRGRTPLLESAAIYESSWSTFRPEIVTFLLNTGADAGARDLEGLGLPELLKQKGFKAFKDNGDALSAGSVSWIVTVDNQG